MHSIGRTPAARWPMLCALGTLAFLFSRCGCAAGAWLSETGGPDMAMASAGRAALAIDGTVVSTNPAGLAELPDSDFVAVALPLRLDLEFRGSQATPGRARNESAATPVGSAFATAQSGPISYGFGAYGNVGLGFDFGREWSGRRAIEQAQLRSLNLVPALAFRATERLDIGASLGAQYAAADARLAVGNDALFYGPPAGLRDGQLRIGGSSWSPVGNLGVTYRTPANATIGLAWTSAVDHSMRLDVDGAGLHPVLQAMLETQGPAVLEVRMPQQVVASVARPLGPATLVAASAGWQQWSAFGDSRLSIAGRSAPMFQQGLRDTWSAAVGLRHRASPRWTLAGGVAYDSDPSSDGTMPVYFPVAEQWRLAAGADYQPSDSLRLRLSLAVISQGTVHVSQESHPVPLPGIPVVKGTIRDSRIYAVGFTADYRP